MRIVKLHSGLFNYLRKELKNKKTFTKLVLFLLSTGKVYLTELLKLYKELFKIIDPEFQKQKKEYEKYNKIRTDLQRALKLLQYIDSKLAKSGVGRQARRQFWRDFYRDGQVRKETFEDLLKEIGR
jgi:hypothetical protein